MVTCLKQQRMSTFYTRKFVMCVAGVDIDVLVTAKKASNDMPDSCYRAVAREYFCAAFTLLLKSVGNGMSEQRTQNFFRKHRSRGRATSVPRGIGEVK
jgi:hypothetical protein